MTTLQAVNTRFDVIVIGAGHAGCEAALLRQDGRSNRAGHY